MSLFSASNAICAICSSVSPAAFSHQSRKYGVNSCDTCRKFISKTVKRLAVASSENSLLSGGVQCKNDEGQCQINASARSARSYKAALKERCPACWLKRCIQTYRLPSELRQKIVSTLPSNLRPSDANNSFAPNAFSQKAEPMDSSSNSNIFANSLNACRRIMLWPKEAGTESEFRTFSSLTNPLAENNVKFGSSPQIVPTILEKPVIMASASAAVATSTEAGKEPKAEAETKASTSTVTPPPAAQPSAPQPAAEVEETSRLRVRKKERDTATVTTTAATTPATTTTVTTASSEGAKRQRIDLKGPRVKHVCRSASIVLGQPIATFPDGTPMLESFDTPPRPESPNGIVEFDPPTTDAASNDKPIEAGKPFGQFADCADSTRLSPPATPIINDYDNGDSSKEAGKSPEKQDENSGESTASKKSDDSKPVTRKFSRPAANSSSNGASNITSKKLNSFIRKTEQPAKKPAPLISIDFWENYDPAEVSQTGFGLIFSEPVQLKALCFLCGSFGQDPLLFCVCCCEPYHQYCVEDEYNLKHLPSDDQNASVLDLDMSVAGNPSNSKLNWLCPRCTVCYTCNMASGSKVKCQKCQKNYHSTCLGTSKRLLGADRPLICASCLKCKSCGTTNVSKFVGNLPMCSACFKLRQKGNFCPLCQKCYDDNDFNIKMMECGQCHRWVHSKCEGLSDEQYNLLSALPENIEFVCKKCAQKSCQVDTWREAVSMEFRAGLLGVVKQLSKSRQACALLKLSPRKKPAAMCRVCYLRQSALSGSKEGDSEPAKSDGEDLSGEDEKCYCSSTIAAAHGADTSKSLLDIKQNVLANKYHSLADFNYDMNLVVSAAACDDLLTTYKEILSEAFPWFQNETKACTDALVEDMYDPCRLSDDSPDDSDVDQQVPMVDVPDDIEECFYRPAECAADGRLCVFCKSAGDGVSSNESRLLYCGQNSWAHINCAMWSAEVFEEIDGSLQNVHNAISRGRMIKCSHCGNKGATVGCNVKNCGEHYHFPCARTTSCVFMTDKTFYCSQHTDKIVVNEKNAIEANFEVNRPVYVELDRRRRRPVSPKCVQFLIGSLHVKQLGRFIPKLSDRCDAIVPADFACTRLYWSTKEPWKIVEYSIRTRIQSSFSVCFDSGRNFTVDHSTNSGKIQLGLAQIAKWHSGLQQSDEDPAARTERVVRSCLNGDETNEEEPQNSADLLPPEIKDAIFEDLPHDILDGISMLDILSNLEDVGGVDSKGENYLSSDFLRETNTDDELSQIDSWMPSNNHVEDVMLSARSASGLFKRNKSDVIARNRTGATHQRPWAKFDSAISSKRRKLPVRLPETVLLTLRRKDEAAANCLPVADDLKNKAFTWSAAKCFSPLAINDASQPSVELMAKRSFKISQLDGMDDLMAGEINANDFAKSPVSCDRCHCAYRTLESYRRHLPACEPMSTSESDSEINSKSPEIQSQQTQSNVVFTTINGQDFCNIPLLQANASAQQSLFGLSNGNLNQITMPITSLHGTTQLPVQMQGMFINSAMQPQQQTMFAQPTLTLAGGGVFPIQNSQTTATTAQTISLQQATSQNIQYQPQILSCTTANTSQMLTGAPSQHQNISAANYAAIKALQAQQQPTLNKNQIILPQTDKGQQKKQPLAKLQASPSRGKSGVPPKAIQMKKANVMKAETSKTMTHITNQSIRTTSDGGSILIQSAPTTATPQIQQPLIVQQLAQPNHGNVLQYVQTADGQYYAVPTSTGDYKPQHTAPAQYLAPNPLMPGTFQLQSTPDSNGSSLLLANTPNGLQVSSDSLPSIPPPLTDGSSPGLPERSAPTGPAAAAAGDRHADPAAGDDHVRDDGERADDARRRADVRDGREPAERVHAAQQPAGLLRPRDDSTKHSHAVAAVRLDRYAGRPQPELQLLGHHHAGLPGQQDRAADGHAARLRGAEQRRNDNAAAVLAAVHSVDEHSAAGAAPDPNSAGRAEPRLAVLRREVGDFPDGTERGRPDHHHCPAAGLHPNECITGAGDCAANAEADHGGRANAANRPDAIETSAAEAAAEAAPAEATARRESRCKQAYDKVATDLHELRSAAGQSRRPEVHAQPEERTRDIRRSESLRIGCS